MFKCKFMIDKVLVDDTTLPTIPEAGDIVCIIQQVEENTYIKVEWRMIVLDSTSTFLYAVLHCSYVEDHPNALN